MAHSLAIVHLMIFFLFTYNETRLTFTNGTKRKRRRAVLYGLGCTGHQCSVSLLGPR